MLHAVSSYLHILYSHCMCCPSTASNYRFSQLQVQEDSPVASSAAAVVGDEMALVSTIQHIYMYDTRHRLKVEHPFVSFIVLTPKKCSFPLGTMFLSISTCST